MRHHGTGADDGVRADGHARRHGHVCAEPHVAADGDRRGALPTGQAGGGILGVVWGGDGAARTNQAVLANGHIATAANHEILVDERVAADPEPDAVIDRERRREFHAFARLRNEFVEQAVCLIRIIEEDPIDPCTDTRRLTGVFRQGLRLAVLRRPAAEQSGQFLVRVDQRFHIPCHTLSRLPFPAYVVSVHATYYFDHLTNWRIGGRGIDSPPAASKSHSYSPSGSSL